MQEDIVSKTLQEIKSQRITPTPVWRVNLPNYLLWSAFVLLVWMSGLSLAIMVRLTSDLDWDAYQFATLKRLRVVLTVLPYLWVILLLTFGLISYVNLRNTKKGYRYNPLFLVLFISGLSFGLGSIIYATHLGEVVHMTLGRMFMPYQRLVNVPERFWTQPEEGLLGGRVLFIRDEGFDLQDFQGNTWIVIPSENIIIRPRAEIKTELRVKVIGNQAAAQLFRAREIRPWEMDQSDEPPLSNESDPPSAPPTTP